MFKKISNSRFLRTIVCFLAAQYIRFVYATNKWEIMGQEIPENLIQNNIPFIVAFWHGRLLMLPCAWKRKYKLHLLISRHNDGELISKTVSHLGLLSIRGSTNKRGAEAVRKLVRHLRSGEWAGISPDGPHGPRMRASEGIVHIARLANVPILPIAYSTNKQKVLSTWDNFIIPYPFGNGVFIWGKPLEPPKSSAIEETEKTLNNLENILNNISKKADTICGNEVINPAPKVFSRDFNANS